METMLAVMEGVRRGSITQHVCVAKPHVVCCITWFTQEKAVGGSSDTQPARSFHVFLLYRPTDIQYELFMCCVLQAVLHIHVCVSLLCSRAGLQPPDPRFNGYASPREDVGAEATQSRGRFTFSPAGSRLHPPSRGPCPLFVDCV